MHVKLHDSDQEQTVRALRVSSVNVENEVWGGEGMQR